MLKSGNWFFRYKFNLVYSDWERTDIVPIYDALVFSGTFWVSLGQLLTSDVDGDPGNPVELLLCAGASFVPRTL